MSKRTAKTGGHIYPIDETVWTAEDGRRHSSQYVLSLSVRDWFREGAAAAKDCKRPTACDVSATIRFGGAIRRGKIKKRNDGERLFSLFSTSRLRSTLYGKDRPDRSDRTDRDMAYDEFGFTACVGHLVGLLRSERFKRAVREAVRYASSRAGEGKESQSETEPRPTAEATNAAEPVAAPPIAAVPKRPAAKSPQVARAGKKTKSAGSKRRSSSEYDSDLSEEEDDPDAVGEEDENDVVFVPRRGQ